MTLLPNIIQRLRYTPVRQLIRGLERDGFTYRRTKGWGRLYRHSEGRRVVIHYHSSGDTLPMGTFSSVLRGARWTQGDLERLGLI